MTHREFTLWLVTLVVPSNQHHQKSFCLSTVLQSAISPPVFWQELCHPFCSIGIGCTRTIGQVACHHPAQMIVIHPGTSYCDDDDVFEFFEILVVFNQLCRPNWSFLIILLFHVCVFVCICDCLCVCVCVAGCCWLFSSISSYVHCHLAPLHLKWHLLMQVCSQQLSSLFKCWQSCNLSSAEKRE